MRFQRLSLLAYGPFTEEHLDLSQGAEGLHVIYGPNEAGKSVALRAISSLLYGIPLRTPDRFIYDYNRLRIGATLSSSQGESLEVIRKKGQKNTLIDPTLAEGGLLPDSAIKAFLGGVERERFERIYCIGRDQLVGGGETLKNLKGLAGESLYAAGLGLVDPGVLLETLDAKAKELYSTRGKPFIKRQITKYRQATAERKQATVNTSQWEKLQRTLKQLTIRRREVEDQLKELHEKKSRLDRLRRALPIQAKRRALRETLATLDDVIMLPRNYSIEERLRCQSDLAHARQRVKECIAAIEGEGGLRESIAAIHIPQEFLEHSKQINDLYQRLDRHKKAAKDIPKRKRDADVQRAIAREQLHELESDISLSEAEKLRLTQQQKTLIHDLGTEERALQQRVESLELQRHELEDELHATHQRAKQAESSLDFSELRRAVNRARKAGDLETQLDRALERCRASEVELTHCLQALELWTGTEEDLRKRSWPVAETIRRFEDEFGAFQEKLRHLDEKEALLREKRADAKREMNSLLKAGEIPTEAELLLARQTRDACWNSIKEKWLRGTAEPSLELADQFESTIAQSDFLVDRLRRESQRVNQLAHWEAASESCHKELQRNAEEKNRVMNEKKSTLDTWTAQWSKLGVMNPLSPPEMREWLINKDRVLQAEKESHVEKREVARLEQLMESHRSALSDELEKLKFHLPEESFATLLDRCQELVERAEKTARHHELETKEIRRLEAELKKTDRKLDFARKKQAHWIVQWKESLAPLGAKVPLSAGQAFARIAALDKLFSIMDKVADLEHRIETMTEDAEVFTAEVQGVTEAIAPHLCSAPLEDALNTLHQSLEKAGRDSQRLEALQEKLEEKQEELAQAKRTVNEMTDRLTQMMTLAGVDNEDGLQEAEERSQKKREAQVRVTELDEQLLEEGSGMTVTEFVRELEKTDPDRVAAERPEVVTKINELEAVRDELIGQLRDVQRESDAVDGSSTAAAADEKALGIVATIRAAAEQYIRFRFASALLRQQVEEHRKKTQDPILARASDLFAQLTCQAHKGLRIDFDEEKPVIKGVRASNNAQVGVEEMSDGTRDQLYLSLRLAYLERYMEGAEPLPFIIDDILVNFDDQRSTATFKVLADLSHKTQIIFFTHHEHLIEKAQNCMPPNSLFIHRLPRSI